jgi:hypothetical protein
MPLARCSLPSWAGPSTPASWSAWTKRCERARSSLALRLKHCAPTMLPE